MRTIGRILVILLAAVAVAGATAILVDNRLLGAQGPGEWGEGLETAEFEGRQRPEGDFDHGERGEHEGGRDGQAGSLLAGLIRNLGIVALIVSGVVLGQWLWSRLSGRGSPRKAALAAEKIPEDEYL